jgi:hypothetical protein
MITVGSALGTLLGGAVAGWPRLSPVQGERVRRVEVIINFAVDNAESMTRMGTFLQPAARS